MSDMDWNKFELDANGILGNPPQSQNEAFLGSVASRVVELLRFILPMLESADRAAVFKRVQENYCLHCGRPNGYCSCSSKK